MSLLHLWYPPRVTPTGARLVLGIHLDADTVPPSMRPPRGSASPLWKSPEEKRAAKQERSRRFWANNKERLNAQRRKGRKD